MRNFKIIQLSLLIILCFGFEVSSFYYPNVIYEHQSPESFQNKENFGEILESDKCNFTDYTFLIETKKQIISKNQEAILDIKLTNKNSQFIRAEAMDVNISNTIEIRNSKQNLVAFSVSGKKKLNKLREIYYMGSNFAVEITQNKSYQYRINLSDYYDLPAGNYEIKVHRKIGVRDKKTNVWCLLPISSNSIKLMIK